MDDNTKDALRERNRRRAKHRCPRCAGYLDLKDGRELDPATHFEGITYGVCGACGNETVVKSGKRGRR